MRCISKRKQAVEKFTGSVTKQFSIPFIVIHLEMKIKFLNSIPSHLFLSRIEESIGNFLTKIMQWKMITENYQLIKYTSWSLQSRLNNRTLQKQINTKW